jgi:hypothetical protein
MKIVNVRGNSVRVAINHDVTLTATVSEDQDGNLFMNRPDGIYIRNKDVYSKLASLVVGAYRDANKENNNNNDNIFSKAADVR